MRRLVSFTVMALVLFFIGCSGSSTKTPDGTIQLLFKYVKAGEMSSIRDLISSGYLDNYDENKLRKLFGSDKITGIHTEVLESKNQCARVLITLVKKSGNKRGNKPVSLVFKDGGWKIDYSGMSWPFALNILNY